jgi:hypothetical protein
MVALLAFAAGMVVALALVELIERYFPAGLTIIVENNHAHDTDLSDEK